MNKNTSRRTLKQSIVRVVLVTAGVLLIPLVAMQFSDDLNWDVADFIIVGILLAGIVSAYQLIVNGMKNNRRQVVIGIVLAAAMIVIWIHLAVGIVNDAPFAGS